MKILLDWVRLKVSVLGKASRLHLLSVLFILHNSFGLSYSAQPEKRDSLVMLVGSILDLIHRDYVDNSKTSLPSLFRLMLNRFESDELIELKSKGENRFAITVQDETRMFQLADRQSRPDVAEMMVDLAYFLGTKKGLVGDHSQDKSVFDKGFHYILNGILSLLDPHSALLTSEEYLDLKQGTEGAFGGLGVLVGIKDHVLTVIKPLPNSPAERIGLKKGDQILSIGEHSTFGFTLDDLVEHMRGPPGTSVKLRLLRVEDQAPRVVRVPREIISVKSVESEMLSIGDRKILMSKIESFASRTTGELLNDYYDHLAKTKKIDGMILDLRGNPGGLLDQAIRLADLFLSKGVIVRTKGNRGDIEYARSQAVISGLPLVVLIDRESASASEIVAGALQDHGRAVIIGKPSFGKGSVQTIFELPRGNALKLTIARYYTPSGKSIQSRGITPDIWLQGVMRQESNVNLLGSTRLSSEYFLRNRLLDFGRDLRLVPENSRKYFYVSENKNDELWLDAKNAKDPELEAAMVYFLGIQDSSALRFAENNQLAFGKSNRNFVDLLTHWTTESLDLLMERYAVDWSSIDTNAESKQLCKLNSAWSVRMAEESFDGNQALIDYKIGNDSASPCYQVSFFALPEDGSSDPVETLIGKIEPGGGSEGTLRLNKPKSYSGETVVFYIGISQGGLVTEEGLERQEIFFPRRKFGEISLSLRLEDEVGGQQVGALEVNEQARLKLIVENTGDISLRSLEVVLTSFTGLQVGLSKFSRKLKLLGSGEKTSFGIPIEVSDHVMSSELGFGVSVDSPDMSDHKSRLFRIPGIVHRSVK